MTTFAETNGEVRRVTPTASRFYAVCMARGCTWVGPTRSTPAAAKRDACRHHDADSGRWAEGGGDW